MSQTKATKIIKRLLDNDFGPSIFLAISHNDEHAFQSALSKAVLTVDDLTLSENEFDSIVKGVKPSGELDLLTWEGYYVVTSLSQSDPLAFLILAGTEKVYWGPQSQVLGDPNSHVVDYQITSDNKLEFTTAADEHVSISLSREYDKEKGIATARFSAVWNGENVLGVKAQAPIDCLKLRGRPQRKASNFVPSKLAILDWLGSPITQYFLTIFGFSGGAVSLFQIYLWIRDKAWRKQASTSLMRDMEEGKDYLLTVAEDDTPDPVVKYDHAGGFIDDAIASHLNQKFHEEPLDFTKDVDEITSDLEVFTGGIVEQALRQYIKQRALPELRQSMEKFRAVPGFEQLLSEIGEKIVTNSVTEMKDRLAPFDTAIRGLVLEAREQHFASDYREAEKSLASKERELNTIKDGRTKLREQIDASVKRIAELEKLEDAEGAKKEEERKRELEHEATEALVEEQKKEQERNQAQQSRDAADIRKESAENESKQDQSKHEWEARKRTAFGK